MRTFSRWGRRLLVAVVFAACSAANGGVGVPRGAILWDTFGVPHIFASSETGVFYGFGWAQAQSQGNIILRLYGEARGRAAEYWGPQFLDSDRWVVTNGIYKRAQMWYRRQTPQFRADLDAFAEGINDYAAKHPDRIANDVKVVLPLTGIDIIAHAERLTNFIYVASPRRVLGGPPPTGPVGSNAWAIAPRKSASGHAILLMNPHLPWAVGYFRYYEAQLEGPGIDMYGATQVGLPVLRFCFNNDVAFTNTVNTILGETTYKLTLAKGGYRFDGKILPFQTSEHTILIKQPDGKFKQEKLIIRRTVQGPAFVRADGTTVALRVAGLDRPGMLKEYWDMGMAHTLTQFVNALKEMQVPTFNIVYADRQGHILYQDNGILPDHPGGDFAYWSHLVPGDSSKKLWNKILPYPDMPRVLDPPSGFLQNANDPPWTSTYPRVLDPHRYVAYVSGNPPITFRAQQSIDFLRSKPRFTFDDLVRLKLSTRSLLADRILPELLAAAAASNDTDVKAATKILESWHHRYDADSRGALLFETWAGKFMGPGLKSYANFAVPWSLDDPIETPRGLGNPAEAVRMLGEAYVDTQKEYGAADRPFGDVSRFHVCAVNLPGYSDVENLGIFPSMIWGPMKAGERSVLSGESWISLVEFSTPLKAEGLLTYGNSSQPGSKHCGDQLRYYARKQLRTFWRTRTEIEKHLEAEYTYGAPPDKPRLPGADALGYRSDAPAGGGAFADSPHPAGADGRGRRAREAYRGHSDRTSPSSETRCQSLWSSCKVQSNVGVHK